MADKTAKNAQNTAKDKDEAAKKAKAQEAEEALEKEADDEDEDDAALDTKTPKEKGKATGKKTSKDDSDADADDEADSKKSGKNSKKKDGKGGKKGKKKKPNIFVRMGRGIKNFFRDTKGEMKRVVWPTGKQVRSNLLVVLVFVVFMAGIIFLMDLAFGWLFKLTMNLAEFINTMPDSSTSSSSLPVIASIVRSFLG